MIAPRPVHEFDAQTIGQVAEYMNTEQAESLLLIAIAATADTSVQAARVEHFDGDSLTLSLSSDGQPRTIGVAWPRSITQRFEVREQFMALYDRALDAL